MSRDSMIHKLQRKLYEKAKKGKIRRIYNLTHKKEILEYAYKQISSNKGSLTVGIDGINKMNFNEDLLEDLRNDLRLKTYRPSGIRRAYIPKSDGTLRPLGIPTFRDRVAQAAFKIVLEPITEAHFLPESNGFRPQRGAWTILAPLGSWMTIGKRTHYHWCIEGDITSAFDNVRHKLVIDQLQEWVNDNSLKHVLSQWMRDNIFLGTFSEKSIKIKDQIQPVAGTPQGGVISPLLFNIAMHPLDEWYARNFDTAYNADCLGLKGKERNNFLTNFRSQRRKACLGDNTPLGNYQYFRYADDFILLGNTSKSAIKEVLDGQWYKPLENLHPNADKRTIRLLDKRNLKEVIHDMGLTLSKSKTKITHLSDGINFLGVTTQIGRRKSGKLWQSQRPEKERMKQFIHKLKEHTSSKTFWMEDYHFMSVTNSMIRGWGMYFKYCYPRTALYSKLSHMTWKRVSYWLFKKHKLEKDGGWKTFKRRYVKKMPRINSKGNEYLTNRIFVRSDTGKEMYLFLLADIPAEDYPYPVFDYKRERELYLTEPQTSFNQTGEWISERSVLQVSEFSTRKQYENIYLENKNNAFLRGNWECNSCQSIFQLTIDHLKPLPTNFSQLRADEKKAFQDLSNLQILCMSCHGRKTRLDNSLSTRSDPNRFSTDEG